MRKLLLIALFLQGCHLGPRYERPETPIPEEWKGEASTSSVPDVQVWWEVFEDELLAQLEAQVLSCNPDLYSAAKKIEEARGIAGVAKADLYPQVSLQPSYNDTGRLIELYGIPPGYPGINQFVRVHEMSYALPLNMNYEVDFWQKYRGRYNAADKYAQSEQESYRALQLTLTTDLATHYFNVRTLDTQNQILQNILTMYGEVLKLRQIRYLSGLDSYLSVLSAIQLYEEAASTLEDSLRQRTLFENAIATLVGIPATCFHIEERTLKSQPPSIPTGLPSTLLVRRPDVASAERSMAAAHDLIGVAYSNFFPSLNLTGALGFLSPDLSQFISWAGHLWQWGAQIFQTIFDGGRRSSLLEFNKALFEETVGYYEKTVLTAFQEVEDALNNLEQEAKRSDELFSAFYAAEERAGLYQLRFEAGLSNQLDLLDQNITQLQAENSWINILGLRYQATIQLIKAIGGSWDDSLPCNKNESDL